MIDSQVVQWLCTNYIGYKPTIASYACYLRRLYQLQPFFSIEWYHKMMVLSKNWVWNSHVSFMLMHIRFAQNVGSVFTNLKVWRLLKNDPAPLSLVDMESSLHGLLNDDFKSSFLTVNNIIIGRTCLWFLKCLHWLTKSPNCPEIPLKCITGKHYVWRSQFVPFSHMWLHLFL